VIDSLTGQGINVPHTCQTLGISESGYYACKDRPDPPRTLRRIWLAGEIADIHKASGSTYLAHRVTALRDCVGRHQLAVTARSSASSYSNAIVSSASFRPLAVARSFDPRRRTSR
jgi:hypothetical protein